MYLSDPQKQHLKQIVELWDELRHAPSSTEFNNRNRNKDENANNMAFYFGSYKEAVELASHYRADKKRKEIGAKPAPKEPEEQEELPEEPAEAPKAPETAPEKPSEPAQEPQKPEELSEPEKQPEPPVKPAESPKKKEATPMITPLRSAVCNYFRLPLYFVSEDELSDIEDEELGEIELQEILERRVKYESNGTAIVMSADSEVDNLSFGKDDDSLAIPIFSTFMEPKVVKDGRVHNFPDPRDGVLLFVDREIAEAARAIGRETDDLIFPVQYEMTDDEIYVSQLGRL